MSDLQLRLSRQDVQRPSSVYLKDELMSLEGVLDIFHKGFNSIDRGFLQGNQLSTQPVASP